MNLERTFQAGIHVSMLALAVILVFVTANESVAQDWSSKSQQSEAGASPRSERGKSEGGYDYTGPYAQFGVSIGQIDFDGPGVDNSAAVTARYPCPRAART